MIRLGLYLSFAFFLASCGTIRDGNVYSAEIQFEDLTVRRAAPAVRQVLSTSCTCDATSHEWASTSSEMTNESCAGYADWYRTIAGRWSWHVSMQRYNGSLSGAEDPGAAPEIAHTCELPEIAQ